MDEGGKNDLRKTKAQKQTENPRVIHEFEGGPVALFWENPSWFSPSYKSEDMKPIVLELCKYHQIFVDHKITPTLDAVAWEKIELVVACEECEDCMPKTCLKSVEEVGEKGSGMKLSETLEGWVIDLAKCTPWDDPVKLKAENTKLKLQLEKVLEAIGDGVPCPNAVDLPNHDNCSSEADCRECWRQALESVGESEVRGSGCEGN